MKRRELLAAGGFPLIVPARFFGQSAPSNLIHVAQIGCGRIARSSEFRGLLKHSRLARFTAVCDLDSVRLADAKQLIEQTYAGQPGAGTYASVQTYRDYRHMLQDKSIDAVCISTPDHWHAQPAMEAALAGKDVYLQKPASLTIHEGRQMADCVSRTGRVFQLGSQQRSDPAFRLACELVRNGRIGKVEEILIGLPTDPSGEIEKPMSVPPNLDYDTWLGSTPEVFYTEKRVHPQSPDIRLRYDRPGWLHCEQFGAGMITGWGAHHIDIAHWAMGLERSGPVKIEAEAKFPASGLWDVHGSYMVWAEYPNGAVVYISDKFPNGIRFIGRDGWIRVTRGKWSPADAADGRPPNRTFDASQRRIIREGIGNNEFRLHASPDNDHHLDWLTSIRSRKSAVAPAEDGHRSCSACLLAWAAMKLGRPLEWDPVKEQFPNDQAANATLSRPQRSPFGTNAVTAV